ncbi:DUF6531 domain-containing protein [Streptomyces aquilus]|uniref:DUF6531 domain-containing protein n=1 Tax=Streptomyces aquilus TaxID=2548456 RepID=UPI0036C8785A
MAGHRPTDWHVLDLEKDPTPGDPDRIKLLAKTLHDFADDVSDALRLVNGMAGEDTLLEWAGKSAEVFKDEFGDVPKNLKKLKKSYDLCGDALADFWPKLERAQALADRALAKGREAQSDLSSANSRLASADSWVTRANKEADKYKDDPTGSKSGGDKPDEGKVRAATRDAQHAKSAQTSAQTDVDNAQGALAAAKKMAEDARKMREEAAHTAKSKIDEASDAGIQNRSWWEEVGDWFTDNWDNIVAVCKVVVAVVGVIAMIIGGPILGAIVLIAALVVLADTLYKYSKGQASLWDVGLAALDCIPGMKGLTTLGGLAKGMKAFGKVGLKGMVMGVKGLGRGARAMGRPMKKLVTCGDPIDMATGQMVMSETDVTLPGIFPLLLERHHRTGLRTGRLFGRSWASTFDQRLQLEPTGVRFITADGMTLHYPVPERDLELLPVEGPRWPMRWDCTPGGDITVHQPDIGQTLHFRPVTGVPEGVLPLHAVSDRNDNRMSIRYGSDGMPRELVHQGGYRIGVLCERGRIVGLTLRSQSDEPVLMRYSYDARGDLAEIRNSSGLPLTLLYDDRHRITGWEDRTGAWYRYEYDGAGRCTTVRGVDGILDYTFDYDDEAHRTLATDSLGYTTQFQFNDAYQLVAETDALGHTTHRTWDRYDSLLSLSDPLGRTTHFSYDQAGRLTGLRLPDGAESTTVFGAHGQPEIITEPGGITWTQTYDDQGNLVEAVDPTGAVTRYTYEPGGRLASHTDALGQVRHITTDLAGLPVRVTDALGAVSECTRDAFGRVVEQRDPLGGVTRTVWNTEGLPLYREGPEGSRETWEWDAEGALLAHTDPAGATTRYEVGPFGLPVARRNPDGAVYRFTYDTEQRLTEVADPQGRRWSYELDAVGRLVAESDFNGSRRTYGHDAAGRLLRRTNGAGDTVEFSYDPLGRVTERRAGDGALTRFAYNHADQIVWARNDDAEVVIERDAVGRILAETVNGRTVTSTYDRLGRRLERHTPSGLVSEWKYDAEDHPVELSAAGHRLSFEYDCAGRETVRRLGGPATLEQVWDSAGRMAEQRVRAEGPSTTPLLQRRRFSHRLDGEITAVDELRAGLRRFGLDMLGRVTSVDRPDGQERYGYDEVGNLTEASVPGLDGHEGASLDRSGTLVHRAGGTTYEHDGQGRVIRRIKRTLSGLRRAWRYAWNADDRLTDVKTPDGERWHYSYDPLGRRTAKQRLNEDGSVAEEVLFVWDGEQMVEEHRDDGTARSWEYLPDSHTPLFQIERSASREGRGDQEEYDRRFYAIVADIVGTPTDLFSVTGENVWRADRTLWGRELRSGGDGIDCPMRFPGQYADRESGWNYNFHRYYDPETAQYTSPDPLGLVPADNDRSYVRNPLSWLDALGLAPCAKALLLKAWRLRNNQGGYSVYHGLDAQGNKIYAGITNNMARREAQHIAKNYGIQNLVEVPGATNLKKWQARAVEQVLIEQVRASGLSRAVNGVPISQINSISPKRAIYGTAVRYGRMFLASNP